MGTFQRLHNMHCVSLDRLYSLMRAHGSSKFMYAKNAMKSGAAHAAPATPFPPAMCHPNATEYGVASDTLGTSAMMDTAACDVPILGI